MGCGINMRKSTIIENSKIKITKNEEKPEENEEDQLKKTFLFKEKVIKIQNKSFSESDYTTLIESIKNNIYLNKDNEINEIYIENITTTSNSKDILNIFTNNEENQENSIFPLNLSLKVLEIINFQSFSKENFIKNLNFLIFQSKKSLTRLVLMKNQYNKSYYDYIDHSSSNISKILTFSLLENLSILRISHVFLSPILISSLPLSLSELTIAYMSIEECDFNTILIDRLKIMEKLKKVDLSNNILSNCGVYMLFGIGSLIDIKLNNCSLNNEMISKVKYFLLDQKSKKELKTLYIENNFLTEDSIEDLCIVMLNTKISCLYIKNNEILYEDIVNQVKDEEMRKRFIY